MAFILAVMLAAAYLLAPIMVIWGWIRWVRRREELGPPFFLSLVGFVLTTASAVLAFSSVSYAVITHGFTYFDPRLLKIIWWGAALSLGGVALGLTGVSRPNVLRWQAPLAGFGMLAFWILAMAGE